MVMVLNRFVIDVEAIDLLSKLDSSDSDDELFLLFILSSLAERFEIAFVCRVSFVAIDVSFKSFLCCSILHSLYTDCFKHSLKL